jgi:hypothetical protein
MYVGIYFILFLIILSLILYYFKVKTSTIIIVDLVILFIYTIFVLITSFALMAKEKGMIQK